MCMTGNCGGSKSKSNSYTPKKMQGTSKPFNQKMFGIKGNNNASANFGSPKVRMSFNKR